MPVLQPAELWQQSGRWYGIKDEMFRLKDRHGRDMCLGMTHEEVVAWLASQGDPLVSRAAADLVPDPDEGARRGPAALGRPPDARVLDEGCLHARPRRCRPGRRLREAEGGLRRIFERCGLAFHVVESDSGMMGGAGAHEFMAPSAAGEDEVALCAACGYAANVELARSGLRRRPPSTRRAERWRRRACGPSPRCASCSGSSPPTPSSACSTWGRPGRSSRWCAAISAARAQARARSWAGGPPGAPRGGPRRPRRAGRARWARWARAVPIVADEALARGGVRGGRQPRGRPPPRRPAGPGLHGAVRRSAPGPGRGGLSRVRQAARRRARHRGREHLQARDEVLGGARRDVPRRAGAGAADRHGVLRDRTGPDRRRRRSSSVTMRTASSGPGRSRRSRSTWCPSTRSSQAVREMAERIYRELGAAGFEAILDDRDERPGVKFKDADLLGIPIRVTVGALLGRGGHGRGANATGPSGCRRRAGRRRGGRPGPRPDPGRRPLVSRRAEGFLGPSSRGILSG